LLQRLGRIGLQFSDLQHLRLCEWKLRRAGLVFMQLGLDRLVVQHVHPCQRLLHLQRLLFQPRRVQVHQSISMDWHIVHDPCLQPGLHLWNLHVPKHVHMHKRIHGIVVQPAHLQSRLRSGHMHLTRHLHLHVWLDRIDMQHGHHQARLRQR